MNHETSKVHHKYWLAEVRIREMQGGCAAGCHSQMKAMLGVYEYPLHVYGSDIATCSDYVPFLTPRWGQFSVGYGLGIIVDSPCTRLFNHRVLLISLQNNYSIHVIHRHVLGLEPLLPEQSFCLEFCFPPIPLHRQQTGFERQGCLRLRA